MRAVRIEVLAVAGVLSRTLSGGFQPPEGACPTYRALYHGLEEFEHDLHRHVHLENNIVFPRALEMERKESACVRS
ncbi:MAG TPA: hypothetical protein VNH18_11110 [Bryobacteraceae bacterium]|nr:hypothetical protein [Bryobacteraceae bacterium]HXJ39819.1 hypothetical protein [Bryobacteraceae bacterium]